jgi:Purple acid Phosphatase, N-terminal domain
MTTGDTELINLDLSRRKLLAAAGIGGAAVVAASLVRIGDAEAAPASRQLPDPAATPPVAGLHLQFGADASSEMVVSWHTLQPVQNPRVVLGHLDGQLEQTVEAKVTSYTDAKSGQIVYAYHAKLGGLQPDFAYLYGAMHDGAEPEFATFRTSPRGRARFMFTSFGDQGTPTLGKKFVPPEGVTIKNPPYVNDNLGSPAAGNLYFTSSTAIFATPISLRTGCGRGGIFGTTTAAAPASVPGCPPPATTKTNSATERSGIRPIRPISVCRTRSARRM